MKCYLDDSISQYRLQGDLGSFHLVGHVPGKAETLLNMSFPYAGEVKAI